MLLALADVHAHLDSTRLGLPFRPHPAGPGLARPRSGSPCPAEGWTSRAPADLLVLPGDTVTSAVMDCPPRALVVREGRVVVRDDELVGVQQHADG